MIDGNEYGADRLTPQRIAFDVEAGYAIDFRERIGGRVKLWGRRRLAGGEYAPWIWAHLDCARYRPEGKPATFDGGAPDWLTAWAYARRHMRNFHGVELGGAGWHVR